MVAHCFAARELVPKFRLAQLKDSSEKCLEFLVLNNGLWPPALSHTHSATRRCSVSVSVSLRRGLEWYTAVVYLAFTN